jgi:hypothetical protein
MDWRSRGLRERRTGVLCLWPTGAATHNLDQVLPEKSGGAE